MGGHWPHSETFTHCPYCLMQNVRMHSPNRVSLVMPLSLHCVEKCHSCVCVCVRIDLPKLLFVLYWSFGSVCVHSKQMNFYFKDGMEHYRCLTDHWMKYDPTNIAIKAGNTFLFICMGKVIFCHESSRWSLSMYESSILLILTKKHKQRVLQNYQSPFYFEFVTYTVLFIQKSKRILIEMNVIIVYVHIWCGNMPWSEVKWKSQDKSCYNLIYRLFK